MEDNFEAAITRMEEAMLARTMSNNMEEEEEGRAPATERRRGWTGQREGIPGLSKELAARKVLETEK